MSLSAGTRLGPYEILAAIGAGGMGEVWKARDTRLDRLVAIKVLPSDKLADPERKRRFVQEAKAASALNHPNIVTIYDIGCESEVDYLAMELVDGKTFEQITPRDGLGIAEVLRYAVQAADALAKAHAAGIVHRDLKPGNLMVTGDGLVKVLDFGLAKLAQPSADVDGATQTIAAKTKEGTILGTAAYMSPEQAEGKAVDARSDIFSFGAVLYEMVTGRRAFRGDTRMSTLSAVLRDDPGPLRQQRQETPQELERVIARCLRKDPARRFQTMADLKVALEELKEEFQSGTLTGVAHAVSVDRSPRRGMPRWIPAAALPLCILGGWYLGRQGSTPQEMQRPVPLTSYPGSEEGPTFSPDGNQVAFSWNGEKQDNYDIYVKVVGPGVPLRLTTDPSEDYNPKWSPDGRTIAFVRRAADANQVMLIPALGGPERKLIAFPRSMFPYDLLSWSPDGKFLVVAGSSGHGPLQLHAVSVETGESRVLTHPAASSTGDTDPAFSPEGLSLAFTRIVGLNVENVWVLPLSKTLEPKGEPRELPTGNSYAGGAAWTGNGREILFSAGLDMLSAIYRIPADGTGKARRLEGLGDGVQDAAISAAGRRLAFSRSFRNSNIWRLEISTGAVHQLIASTFREVFPQYSPDGKRIVFYSNRSGTNQIWVCDADGSNAVQLTTMKGTTNGTPRWAPDGETISFDSNATGEWQIYTVNAGGGKPKQMTFDEFTNVIASWSRDGRWIYYTAHRGGEEQVWKMPSGGGAAVQVTRHGGMAGVESVDGKTLYFVKQAGAGAGVWKMPVEGGEESRISNPIYRYDFAVTEKGMYYATPTLPGAPSAIEYVDFETGKVKTLYTLTKAVELGLAVSPDGRYVLFAEKDFDGSDLMLVENFQ
jgi:Tol biopolymer transport system component